MQKKLKEEIVALNTLVLSSSKFSDLGENHIHTYTISQIRNLVLGLIRTTYDLNLGKFVYM